MESSQRATTAPTITLTTTVGRSARRLLRASRRHWRLSTTPRGLTLAWLSGTEITASISTVRSPLTLQVPTVKEMTRVWLRPGWTTTTRTLCPLMRLTPASTWGRRTSRAWTRTPPRWETIQIWTQTARPWPGRALCLTGPRGREARREDRKGRATLTLMGRGETEVTGAAPVPVQRPQSPDPTQPAPPRPPEALEAAWSGWRASQSRSSGSWRDGVAEEPHQRAQTSTCRTHTRQEVFPLRFVSYCDCSFI